MSIEQFGYKQELRRTMSYRDLLVYGMIFMVPIAPFGIYGYVFEASQGMVSMAYLLGLVGMLFTALSYAAMSRDFPIAGSAYAYTSRGAHPAVGFMCGWLLLLDYILVPALLFVIAANSLQALLPALPKGVWVLGFVLLCSVVNLRGLSLTAQVNRWFLAGQLLVLALFVGVGLWALYGRGVGAGALTSQAVYNGHLNWSTVAAAASIAVLSFLGFDGISTLAEEVKPKPGVDERSMVGRATLAALFIMGALFVLQTWIAGDIANGMAFKSPDSAFYEIAGQAGGPWLYAVTALATALAWGVANALVAQAAVARILFSMGRDQQLPMSGWLARIHPKHQTPYVATLLVSVLSLVVGFVFLEKADVLSKLVNFGALTAFVLLNLTVVWHFLVRKRSGRWLLHGVCPLVGVAILGFVLLNQDALTHQMGGAWLALGLVYFSLMRWVFRRETRIESLA